jgi:hypothetical protein
VGIVPKRPFDIIGVGVAYSKLNDTPGAGEFFFPGVPSESKDLRASETMFQAAYESTFVFPAPGGYYTLSAVAAYTWIPDPGVRPDIPGSSTVTLRLIALF